MSHKPEDYIEKLFKEASQKYEIPFNEQDWNHMEQKLKATPKAAPAKSSWFGKYLLLTGSLFLLFWAIYHTPDQRTSEEANPVQSISQEAEYFQKDLPAGTVLYSTETTTSIDQNYHTDTGAFNNPPATGTKENPFPSEKKLSFSSDYAEDDSFNKVLPISNEIIPETHSETFNSYSTDETEVRTTYDQLGKKELSEEDFPLVQNTSGKLVPLQLNDSASHAEMNAGKEKGRSGRLKMRLSFSPDFSSTRWTAFNTPGIMAGIGLDYVVLNRLYVTSGVFRSNKVYTTKGDEYKAPEDFWKYGVPEYSEGQCTVLEIPLNLRYDVVVRPTHRLFVSSGLSSYLMLSEVYKFTYKQNNYYQTAQYAVPDPGTHFMSVFNISFGMEYWVNHRLSLQAEPFARIPLEGIGFNQINLLTKGISISLAFKPF